MRTLPGTGGIILTCGKMRCTAWCRQDCEIPCSAPLAGSIPRRITCPRYSLPEKNGIRRARGRVAAKGPQRLWRRYGTQRCSQPTVSSSTHAGKVLAGTPERAAQPVHGAVDHHDVEFVAEEFWRVMVMTTA